MLRAHVLLMLLMEALHALERPPTFVLDLDAAPRQRWHGALSQVLSAHNYASGFLPIFAAHNATLFNRLPVDAYQTLGRSLEQHWPERAEELRGISDDFASHGHYVGYEYLAAWAWFHELAHSDISNLTDSRACTAMLAFDATSGTTLHVGNMDQSPRAVRNVTLHVRVTRGGKTIFQGVDW